MAIQEVLKVLLTLQEIDKAIYDREQELKAIPEEKKEFDSRLASKESAVKDHDKRLKDLQIAKKNKELDLEKKEADIKKRDAQLYQVKTNKEYSAIDSEIKGLQADNSLLEDYILKYMDEIEIAEKAMKVEKDRLAEEKKVIDGEKARLDKHKAELDTEVAQLKEKRAGIIPAIDKKTLARYERILNGREGLAMVPIKGETCGGCFYNIPPQVVNDARFLENIIFCEHCSRILYPEDLVHV